jgi:putative transcriptional regulator
MIVFVDIMKKLSDAGWSTYRIRKEKVIGNGTLQRIKANQSISTDTIDTICSLCDCQPGDLMVYIKEDR